MNVPFLDLGRAYEELAEEYDARLLQVARSGAYVLGANVTALEDAVADYLGVSHTVAVGSGTDALHVVVVGLGIGPGDEVITSPFTFAATLEAIEYVNAQPVLVDIDADSYNIDADLITNAITEKTRAIIPVHMFGLPADMRAIMDIAARQTRAHRCEQRQTPGNRQPLQQRAIHRRREDTDRAGRRASCLRLLHDHRGRPRQIAVATRRGGCRDGTVLPEATA